MDKFSEWLNTPIEPSLCLEIEPGIFYVPIGVVKDKINYAEREFGAIFNFSDFTHNLTVFNKVLIASGSLTVSIMQENLGQRLLVGAATFYINIMGENTHYAATLKSLCVVNGLSWKYPAFGSCLNKEQEVVEYAKKKTEKIEPDFIIRKKYAIAVAEKNEELVRQYEEQYNFQMQSK